MESYAKYKKAEHELMISESALRQAVEKLRIENADIGLLKATVSKQSGDISSLERVIYNLSKGKTDLKSAFEGVELEKG